MDTILQYRHLYQGIGIILMVLVVTYSSVMVYREKLKKPKSEPAQLVYGPYPVPLWEKIMFVFLVFLAACYGFWQFGIKRFIIEETGKGGDLRPLILVIIMGVLMVFGYFLISLIINRKSLEASFSQRSPRQRYLGYLKNILMWIAFILIGWFILK